MKILLPLIFFAFAGQLFAADKWLLDVPKDSYVVLKPNKAVFGFEKLSAWSGRNTYGAAITQFEDKIRVNGDENWRALGWSTMAQCVLAKTDRKKNAVMVEIRCGNDNVNLTFDASIKDLNKAFKEVVYVGNLPGFLNSDYYLQEVEKRFLPKVFSGKLEAIPLGMQRKLIEFVNFEPSRLGGEEYKEKFYLKIGGADDFIYNSLQVNQPLRTSLTVQKIIAMGIKDMVTLKVHKGLDGLKVEVKMFFKDFLREANPNFEDLSVYFTFEELEKFQKADITSQQLIDNSIVLINGNRVQVSLTQF